MKKILPIILLLISVHSYSQVDSTRARAARETWLSNSDNWSNGQTWPNFDLEGNIIPFTSLLLLGSYLVAMFKKRSQSSDYKL